MSFTPTQQRVSAIQRVMELQDSIKREGVERGEFIGRMDEAIYHGRAPGAPLDHFYPSGRSDAAVQSKAAEAETKVPVWEPPHYRRPWDSIPLGGIAADPYSIMAQAAIADPRFHMNYGASGHGIYTPHQQAWRNVAAAPPVAPRYPFQQYPVGPWDPATYPLGYDPLLSGAKEAADAQRGQQQQAGGGLF